MVDSIKPKRILSETDYRDLKETAPGVFKAEMGAGAIRDLISRTVDLDELAEEVYVTVIHEIAHAAGIDDDRLHELGWG